MSKTNYKYEIITNKEETRYKIYKAITPSGRIYVGMTGKIITDRISGHVYTAIKENKQYPFSRSIRKYGIENIKWYIIDYANSDKEMRELEIYWIKELNTYIRNKGSNGLNLTPGGEGVIGYKYNLKERKELSERRKIYYIEHPEAREESSKRLKNLRNDPKFDKNRREAFEEFTKDSIRMESMKQACRQVYDNNPELREHMIDVANERWSHPENKEKHSEIMQQYYIKHPETLEKSKEGLKQYLEVYIKDRDLREKSSISHGAKPFNVYNKLTGQFIGQWISLTLCSEDLEVKLGNLKRCLSSKTSYAYDYILIYIDEDNEQELQKRIEKAKKNERFKQFNVYKKEDDSFIMSLNSLKKCSEILSIPKNNIGKCLYGKLKQTHGYLFYYPENDPFLDKELFNSQQDSSFLIAK